MAKLPLTGAESEVLERIRRAGATGTLYEVLGLERGAPRDQVESAYRDFVREWHPDRFYSREVGDVMAIIEDNFVLATRAYKTLRAEARRSNYDRGLGDVSVQPPPSDPPPEPAIDAYEVSVTRSGDRPQIRSSVSQSPQRAPTSRPVGVLDRIRAQVQEQVARAARYYEAGKEDFTAGRYTKAESALYLATRYDPRNGTYVELYQAAANKARQSRAAAYISVAQQAEQYQNTKEAIAMYRKAVECDPEEGLAFVRLANILREFEEDQREALALMRKAIAKEPRNPDFRVALGEMFVQLDMRANAIREAQAALEADRNHEGAKALLKKAKR
jgi:tetratricopeptide (TPR) repeat protein